MGRTIAIIAPLIDNCQFNLDFTVRLKDSNLDLSLARMHKIASGNYNPEFEKSVNQVNDIPAAGYYLQGILHLNGYNTILTNKYDTETLRELSQHDLFAVCVSTTMILTGESFIALTESIEKEIPGIPVISGGMFLWKQYQQYLQHLNFPDKYPLNEELFFHPSHARSTKSIFIVAEQGIDSLLSVLALCEKGSKACFDEVQNLCLQYTGNFVFTKREIENIDYNTDVTRWDLINEMPVKIPVRTSIGCPYRCGFCDFCKVFPRIFMRSPESLKAELQLIKTRLNGNAALIHVTDDNVFITSRRLFDICNIFSSSGLANWIGFMRGGEYSSDELKAIRSSGLRLGMIGVESGDQGQLDRMNKRQNINKVKTGIEQLDEIGVSTLLTFVLGFPGETDTTVSNTINFLNGLKLSNLVANYHAYPLLIQNLSELAEPDYQKEWEIKGFMNNWSHKTMNSDEALKASYKLFREVTVTPYHYPSESHFFNMGMFRRDKLGELYRLRQQLTLNLIDHSSSAHQTNIIQSMLSLMDLPVEGCEKFNENLVCMD